MFTVGQGAKILIDERLESLAQKFQIAMDFPESVKREALVKSRRCCCVCEEFFGRSVVVHHIIPNAPDGPNDLNNAIVLCFNCHAEAGHYNSNHPLGIKYSPEELRRHRDNWWEWCEKNPAAPIPKTPIKVFPTRADLRVGPWNKAYTLKISNSTDNFYFQILIRIILNTPKVSTSTIKAIPLQAKNEAVGAIGNLAVSGDVIRIDGLDELGREIIILQLESLNPHELVAFRLVADYPYISPENATTHVSIEVWDFGHEPLGMASQKSILGDQIAIPFTPPETFTCKSMSFLIKKSE